MHGGCIDNPIQTARVPSKAGKIEVRNEYAKLTDLYIRQQPSWTSSS
jgi:hypothetical protein